jgi:murein DD-endopeptidase MepM/ murein hydrolase activator NlpD
MTSGRIDALYRIVVTALLACTGLAQAAGGAAPSFQGHWQQGGLIVGHAAPGTRVTLDGRALRVSPDGWFVFGFHRDDPAQVTLVYTPPGGAPVTQRHAVQQRQYAVQRIDRLPGNMVSPSPDIQRRIDEEAARVKASRAMDSDLPGFHEGFVWPVQGRVTSVYGSQRILNGVPKQPHYGIDIAAPTGTPVLATAAGIVRLADRDQHLTGGTIIVDHGGGVSSTYLHLSKVLVKVGDTVAQGARIGLVGATGRATGPHLCFRYNWFDARLDPQLLLPAQPARPGKKTKELGS